MRVLLTGGTGFLGSHAFRALREAGHDVRLLVRSPARIAPALAPHGIEGPDYVVGDITDAAAVEAALEGCEAVVHAANVFELDARRGAEMLDVNPRGTELVLRAAQRRGLDPIVHVSSIVALMPSANGILTNQTPLGDPPGDYARSKVAAERIARALQEEGAPIVIVHPAAIIGPHDPYVGGTVAVTRDVLSGRVPMLPPGSLPIADVRDVAVALASTLVSGRGPRRYLAGAGNISFSEMVAEARRLSGRRLPAIPIPAGVALAAGRAADLAQRLVPAKLPISHEGVWLTVEAPRLETAATEADLDVGFRAPLESLADTIRWLASSGRISRRQAGRIAS